MDGFNKLREGEMMDGDQRRSEIVKALNGSEKPVSATSLAKQHDVSRQVIVQDIALLRATGYDILATARGYIGILPNHAPIVGAIRPGYITLHYENGDKQVGLVNYGVYYFRDNELTILSDFFEFSCHGVDTDALVQIKNKILEASKRAQLSEKTSASLNSYMKAVTYTASKNTKK